MVREQRRLTYENERFHGFLVSSWFMAFRFAVASCSLCPPDRKTIPGTAAGTVLCRAVTVALAICSLVALVPSDPAISPICFK